MINPLKLRDTFALVPWQSNCSLRSNRYLIQRFIGFSVPYCQKTETSTQFLVDLFDTNGIVDGRYSRLRPLAYPATDVFLICFSTISRESFTNVTKQWRPEILYRRCLGRTILVGLKTDLRNLIEEEQQFNSEKRTRSSLPEEHWNLDDVDNDPESDGSPGRPWVPETLKRHNKLTGNGEANHISTAEGEALARCLRARYVEGNAIDAFSDLTSLRHEIIHAALKPPIKPEKCIHIFPLGLGFKLVHVHTDYVCKKAWSVKIPGFKRFHV